MKKIWLCLDVGGTQIKAGAVDENGSQIGKTISYPSHAKSKKAEFIKHICTIYLELTKEANAILFKSFAIGGIGIAFPGPFDYQNGICLIQGLDKFDKLYGINIKEELESAIAKSEDLALFKGVKTLFINDVSAFAIGASQKMGVCKKELCVCIGTGCGSAFLIDGRAVTEGDGVPLNGYIYPVPFLESTIDDYISKRGLSKITKRQYGREIEGLELSALAKEGDEKAIKCFNEFGENLSNAFLPIINDFYPNAITLGGQLLKSEELFTKSLRQLCSSKNISLRIQKTSSETTFYGLYSQMKTI